MSEIEERYPRIEQVVTVIAVRNLEAAVLGATVAAVDGGRYDLRVEETDRLDSTPVAPGGRVKLLYGSGPMVWRLAGSIDSVEPESGRLVVQCPDPPRPGERREFIRAEMVLTFLARPLATDDVDEALAKLAEAPASDDDPAWKIQLVDLSGSGMKLRMDDRVEKDTLVEVRVRLQPRPQRPMDLVGRVVRCVPLDDEAGCEVALRFEKLTEEQQDALINLAFRVRYEQLGA